MFMTIKMEELEKRGITVSSLLRHFLENKNLDESIKACLIDLTSSSLYHEKYVKNTLVPKYRVEASKMLGDYIDFISVLEDLGKVLERRWHLDKNWIIAVICLAAQDVISYEISQELGIKVCDEKGRFKSTVTLLKEIEEKLETKTNDSAKHRLSAAIGAAREYYEEFRNRVIHRGELDNSATPRILNITKDMLQELSTISISKKHG
jgi:hypothetical protein